MDKTAIKNLVRERLRVAQSQTVTNIGSGTPVFKTPFVGTDFAAVMTRPLTEEEIFNTIKSTLNSIGFNPNQKYTREQQEKFNNAVINALSQKYGKHLEILNPNLGNVRL
jgi:hypothetical protein